MCRPNRMLDRTVWVFSWWQLLTAVWLDRPEIAILPSVSFVSLEIIEMACMSAIWWSNRSSPSTYISSPSPYLQHPHRLTCKSRNGAGSAHPLRRGSTATEARLFSTFINFPNPVSGGLWFSAKVLRTVYLPQYSCPMFLPVHKLKRYMALKFTTFWRFY